ncbi:MAG: hypothetical protein IJT94_11125 [Oscillibacter sp.]|nr:hypothetical protein [Oscillibacter sp.]
MKKCACAFLVLTLLLVLSGCGAQAVSSKVPAAAAGGSMEQILEDAAGTETDAAAEAAEAAELVTAAAEAAAIETASGTGVDAAASSAHDGIDVDLTRMSSTMVYGQVSDIMYMPDNYVGKTIRMRGQSYSSYFDETDTTYYYILIADATECCAQGIEYTLTDGTVYPADETEATVTGVFELYDELGVTYCRLKDAVVEA